MILPRIKNDRHFFTTLHSKAKNLRGEEGLANLLSVFTDYFLEAQTEADVGIAPKEEETTPEEKGTGPKKKIGLTLRPIVRAVLRLADWSEANEGLLWNAVHIQLSGGPSEFDFLVIQPLPNLKVLEPATENEEIALASALYLAGWEHLRYVDGKRARQLAREAMSLLSHSEREV